MAKATVDGTIACPKCGNTITVETQRFTGGSDHEREVYIKCLRCQSEILFGVYKKYGNSLVRMEDSKAIQKDTYHEQPHIDPIFQGRWIGITFISGMVGRPGYEEIPIANRIFCTASSDRLVLPDGQELIVDKVTVGRILDSPERQNLIQFTNGDHFLIIKLDGDRIGVTLDWDEDTNPTKRFEGRIAPAKKQ